MESEIDVHTLKSQISRAQNEIKLNPYNYDGHVELISLFSKLYFLYKSEESNCTDDSEKKSAASEQMLISFKKLRHSRQSMSIAYPLTADLWLKWIDDEVNAPQSMINYNFIEELFSKATVDYLGVDIWCSYIIYLSGRLRDGGSTPDLIRDTLEKAVTNCGLHYWDGHKIWKCYIDFELQLLDETKRTVQENNSENGIEQFKTGLLKVIKLFKREMSLALANHDNLFDNFKETIIPYIDFLKSLSTETEPIVNIDEIEVIHKKTSENMKSVEIHENDLREKQYTFYAYQSYISDLLNAGLNDPARIQCLFERAIVHHCLKPTLWLDYIDFLNNIIKFPDLVIGVCKRALRNVTWDFRIDSKYAAVLEEFYQNDEEIRVVYEEGLQRYASSGYNYCNLFILYLCFEKRICKNGISIVKKKSKIYEMIQQAVHQLQQIADADKGINEFVLFWVDIEKNWFDSEEKVQDIWKYMLAKFKSLWCPAITYARTINSADLINDLFLIVLLQYPDDSETFCQSMLNHENTIGTHDSSNALTKKINLSLPDRMQARTTKESQAILSKIEHKNRFIKSWLRNAEGIVFSTKEVHSEVFGKRNKRVHETSDSKVTKAKKIGVKKVYLDVDDDEEESRQETRIDKSVIGPVLPPGFLAKNRNESDSDDSTDDEMSDEEEHDDDEDDHEDDPPSKKKKIEKEKVPEEKAASKFEAHPQDLTVFVSNLHPATKEADLRNIFSRAGDVKTVDLRRQRGGKIFAFVGYSTREEAQKAFELEHTPLLNRPIFVSQFKQKNADKDADYVPAAKYSKEQERNKLYVSNLHKLTTQIDLEKLFNQYGDMSSLRLINKKGSSRVFAYVEYATVEAASRYLKAINNTIVRGQAIQVEYSNPSGRNTSNQSRPFSSGGMNFRSDGKHLKSTVLAEKPSAVQPISTNDDETFVKPKPVRLGLVPFQARKNQQTPAQPSTKTGPAVRINFVPAGNVAPKTETTSNEMECEVSTSNGEQSSTAAVSSARKSNDEFRKMFFKN